VCAGRGQRSPEGRSWFRTYPGREPICRRREDWEEPKGRRLAEIEPARLHVMTPENGETAMDSDYLDLYERASAWALDKVRGATDQLPSPTLCDGWDVQTLMNHMLDTQRYFLTSARGEDASPISPQPPPVLSDDPVAQFERGRAQMLEVFGRPGVQEKTGPALGIAFSDQLLHGWDLARATDQDATMPDGLAQASYDTIHGRFTDDQREGVFKPELPVGTEASAQDKLLAFTGRDPG
jgi:uncharacterized protein (TIGR03086 family)